jgi:hypothetical protein
MFLSFFCPLILCSLFIFHLLNPLLFLYFSSPSLYFFLVFLSSLVFSIFSRLFLCFSTLRILFLFFFYHLFVLSSSQKCHSHHFFSPGLVIGTG